MLKVYIQKNNASSKNLVNWLENEEIEYQKRYIDKEPLSEQELLDIMSLTEDGFEDILSYRSLEYCFNLTAKDIDSLTVKELVRLMLSNPTLIRKPIVIRGEKLIVGYDKSQIRTLIPREVRLQQRRKFFFMSEIFVK